MPATLPAASRQASKLRVTRTTTGIAYRSEALIAAATISRPARGVAGSTIGSSSRSASARVS